MENIHAEGPRVYAHEIYQLNGAVVWQITDGTRTYVTDCTPVTLD